MTPTTRDILNAPELVAARDAHFDRLRDVYRGGRPEPVAAVCGRLGQGAGVDPYDAPERWVEATLDDLATHADAARDPDVFRPLVVEFGAYGVHFVDRIFGARVYELREKGNWQVEALGLSVGELTPPDLDGDPTWALARRATEAFVLADVAAPLLGMPTLASALNIGLNLFGQDLLTAFLIDPEGLARGLGAINDTIAAMHRWYLAHVPLAQLQPVVAFLRTQPPGFGQICGCSTQLVSPDQYRETVAPLDEALLALWPEGGMLHLCGTHTQHIPVWREMTPLRALQLNDRAAEDLEIYFHEMREDQVFYVEPCVGMPVERIMAITNGRRVVIQGEPTPGETAT